ncbi:MAG TPA: TerC family protein [Rhizomicrobium sp.]|nr:TerC family protein [Rhizomicrobium sp.]
MLDPAYFALLQVILIDIVLAGDNAVVIGMAAAHVPKEYRAKVIFWGLAIAVVLRIVLASVTTLLLDVMGLMLAGGVLLLWVSWRLYRDLRRPHGPTEETETLDEAAKKLRGRETVRQAIIHITLADLSMSLDNVLAVAGAAMHHVWVLAVGLVLSVALMGAAANFIANVLERHRWIGYAGLLLVVYVACSMIYHGGDKVLDAVT